MFPIGMSFLQSSAMWCMWLTKSTYRFLKIFFIHRLGKANGFELHMAFL